VTDIEIYRQLGPARGAVQPGSEALGIDMMVSGEVEGIYL
jgi:hypothetical protein